MSATKARDLNEEFSSAKINLAAGNSELAFQSLEDLVYAGFIPAKKYYSDYIDEISRLADEADAASQFELFIYYQMKAKTNLAEQWLDKCARQNYPEALLQSYYRNSSAPLRNKQSLEKLMRAADANEADAQIQLAGLYYDGIAVQKNRTRALELIEKAIISDINTSSSALYICKDDANMCENIVKKYLNKYLEDDGASDNSLRDFASFLLRIKEGFEYPKDENFAREIEAKFLKKFPKDEADFYFYMASCWYWNIHEPKANKNHEGKILAYYKRATELGSKYAKLHLRMYEILGRLPESFSCPINGDESREEILKIRNLYGEFSDKTLQSALIEFYKNYASIIFDEPNFETRMLEDFKIPLSFYSTRAHAAALLSAFYQKGAYVKQDLKKAKYYEEIGLDAGVESFASEIFNIYNSNDMRLKDAKLYDYWLNFSARSGYKYAISSLADDIDGKPEAEQNFIREFGKSNLTAHSKQRMALEFFYRGLKNLLP